MNSFRNRTVEARWVTRALALLVFFVTAEAAGGQELEFFRVSGSSDNAAFESYSGIGVATAFALTGGLRLRAALETESNSLMRDGWVCNQLKALCALETGVLDETRRNGLSVTLQADLALSDRVRVSAGAGPHFSKVRMEATSVSTRSGERPTGGTREGFPEPRGRIPTILAPKTLQLGVVLSGGVRIRPVATLPLVISAGWDRKLVKMNGCVNSNDTRTYAPFCGWDHFSELRFGFGVVF